MDKAENIVNEQRLGEHLDYRDKAWFWDKCFEILMFVAGVSAIFLIISIFFFITKEGFGFLFESFSFSEFLLSVEWRPTSLSNPNYGILALVIGTASVTGFAMLLAVPFSLCAAIFILSLIHI